ncbi:protein transporter [Acaromyces ingoldii]|uniref:Mitochondrial import inner membrane translocase subunit TIM16 n=1 Tax=Acaromyces ingoldii TaxID=215250 RepID=A0A316YUV0_9BASI|nr:protein transporter [Acaromyces ingoldii]PWN92882.1 protein transporter [Acaromyces ingoldii]
MSVPRLLAQVFFLGSQIVGKAFMEAGRQAVRNARAGRVEAGAAAAGSATTGNSATDMLTRTHRMTLDEARLILNLGKQKATTDVGAEKEVLLKNYEHLFATNAPPAPKGKQGGGQGSFYIQSKVVRARERIEAEWKEAAKRMQQQTAEQQQQPPPPPSGSASEAKGPDAPH